MTTPLLRISDLEVTYGQRRRRFTALKGVSLQIASGETLGLVGESGSGKTTIGRAVLGQVPVTAGSISWEGANITRLPLNRRRGFAKDIQVVFQDPYSSLNPTKTIGASLVEALWFDRASSPRERQQRAAEVLEQVGLPADTASRYPRQFSGGQRQRICIARAIMAKPRLLVCDEPVSGLDLSVQAQVLNLLLDLQRDLSLSMLFVSHDLAVVRHIADRVTVLRHGEIVEEGATEAVYQDPQHPYTRKLLEASPLPNPEAQAAKRARRELFVASST
jgi:ABC-type glutathione transport system ATPase component